MKTVSLLSSVILTSSILLPVIARAIPVPTDALNSKTAPGVTPDVPSTLGEEFLGEEGEEDDEFDLFDSDPVDEPLGDPSNKTPSNGSGSGSSTSGESSAGGSSPLKSHPSASSPNGSGLDGPPSRSPAGGSAPADKAAIPDPAPKTTSTSTLATQHPKGNTEFCACVQELATVEPTRECLNNRPQIEELFAVYCDEKFGFNCKTHFEGNGNLAGCPAEVKAAWLMTRVTGHNVKEPTSFTFTSTTHRKSCGQQKKHTSSSLSGCEKKLQEARIPMTPSSIGPSHGSSKSTDAFLTIPSSAAGGSTTGPPSGAGSPLTGSKGSLPGSTSAKTPPSTLASAPESVSKPSTPDSPKSKLPSSPSSPSSPSLSLELPKPGSSLGKLDYSAASSPKSMPPLEAPPSDLLEEEDLEMEEP